jgi:plastocyanin
LIVSKLTDIEMTLAADQCVMPKSAVKLPVAVAHDCGDETDINGVATNVPENYPVGLTTIKWTFTDKSGNIKTCDQKVTINDNTPPAVTCPSDVTVDALKNECSASVSLSPLTITDKCDGNITAKFVSRSDTKALDDIYPVGTTTVTWTFTDKSTNVTTCKQNITVKDITPPELDCGTVNSFTIPTNLNSCSVEASVVAGKITVPTAHDACDNADITLSVVHRYYRGLKGTDAPVLVTKTDGVTPAEWNTGEILYKPGYTDIYFIFKDAAGNADSCKKTVFVNDINAPSIICNTSSYTLHPAAGQCSVTIDPAVYYPGQATDICQNTKLDGTLVNLDDPSKTVPASITISSGTTVNFGWIYIPPQRGRLPLVPNQSP